MLTSLNVLPRIDGAILEARPCPKAIPWFRFHSGREHWQSDAGNVVLSASSQRFIELNQRQRFARACRHDGKFLPMRRQ
jgi:hypothetical protein